MISKSLFPRALAAFCAFTMLTLTATAQIEDASLRQTATTPTTQSIIPTVSSISGSAPRLETDAVIVSLAEVVTPSARSTGAALSRVVQLDQLLHSAIDLRLGAPYVYGASGPHRFDCSGFVWSVFQSAGVRFDRTSARALWGRFLPARSEDRTRFGTLVFFNNLTHVGVVADDHGFYHASSSRGVIYSTFNEYWSSRIDGYRRVPVEEILLAE